MKKYDELWSKIRDLIRLITNNSDDYDEKYIKIKFNSDDDLPLKKMLKLFFHEDNKYYSQFFLD